MGVIEEISGNETYLYDDVTAGEFKEWDVTKINHRNRRQKRKLGIDQVYVCFYHI